MALANGALIFLATLLALWGVCSGAVYKVGDSDGWTSMGSVNYKHWASTKSFHVGDTIIFAYNSEYHNVLQVTHDGFRSCNATSPIKTYNSGFDWIIVKRPGHLCSYVAHQAIANPARRLTSGSPCPYHNTMFIPSSCPCYQLTMVPTIGAQL